MLTKNKLKNITIKRNNTEFYYIDGTCIALSCGIFIATDLDISVSEYVSSAIDRFLKDDYGAVRNKQIKSKSDEPIGIYPINVQGNLFEEGIYCYKYLHPKFGPLLLMCLSYES